MAEENDVDLEVTASAETAESSPGDGGVESGGAGLTLSPEVLAIAQGRDLDSVADDPPPEPDDSGEAEDDSPAGDDKPESWIDDDDRSLARAFDLTDEDLAAFGSKDGFLRAAMAFGRSRMVDRQEPIVAPKAIDAPPQEAVSAGGLDPQKYKDAGYDDEFIKLVQHVARRDAEIEEMRREHARVQAFARQAAEQDRARVADAFHSEMDKLDEGLFGRVKEGKLNLVHDENRRQVWEAWSKLQGMTAREIQAGKRRATPTNQDLLKAATQMVFGEELRKADRREFVERVSKQSRTRRSVGRPKPSLPAASSREVEPEVHPKVREMFRKFQADNGVA